MTAWSHLPNAAHIDRVLAHLEAHPERWNATRSAARSAARDAAWDIAWDATRSAAWNIAWDATRSAARDAARDAAWDAIAALIAYDDAAIFLSQTPEQLRMLHRIDPHPMFLLLQPAAIAMSSDEIKP